MIVKFTREEVQEILEKHVASKIKEEEGKQFKALIYMDPNLDNEIQFEVSQQEIEF